MKQKIYYTLLFAIPLLIQAVYGQTANMYIQQENVRLAGITTDAQVDTLSLNYKQTAFQYFDGLARPLQSIGLKATPLQKDMIAPVAYDNLGRQTTSYLPYTDGGSGGYYRTNALIPGAGQAAFYSTGTANNLIARDDSAFVSQVFESSPLQRMLKAGMVGNGFQPNGSQHYKTVSYRSNLGATDGNILRWNFDGTFTSGTWYGDNTLAVTDGTDEDGIETLAFTDLAGRTILKRQVHSPANLDTYYIYNTAGMLSYIVPPKATALFLANLTTYTVDAAPLNTLVFKFTYNGHGLVTSKTVPAKGTMYIIYDPLDRPVLMQDANMQAGHKWNYIKYDAKGRVISQGIYLDNTYTTPATMQSHVSGLGYATWYENRNGTSMNGGYYTNNIFPTTGITPLAYAYFDDYDLNQNGTDDYSYAPQGDLPHESSVTTSMLKGMPTIVSKTTIGNGIAPGLWLTKVIFYDKYGHPIQEQSNNHMYVSSPALTDTKTIAAGFTGVPTGTKVVKKTGASAVTTVYTYMTYDHMYRVSNISQKYNTGAVHQVAAYKYNEVGQVISKGLGPIAAGTLPVDTTLSTTYSGTHTVIASHSITMAPGFTVPSGSTFKAFISTGYLQTVDFRYNIRGQLLSINNSKLSNDGGVTNNDNTDSFGMQFLYDKTDTNLSNTAVFNGRLTGVTWMSKDAAGTSSYERSYTYKYDDLGRYTAANYAERATASTGTFNNNTGGFDESGITYDENGNIIHLNRNSSTQGTNANIQVDNLTYTYDDSVNPNRLLKVSDGSGANYTGYGFRNLTGASVDSAYTYDANGNLRTDPYKGLALYYNDLNRTGKITIRTATNRYINYTYDATGVLLRKQAYDNNILQSTTDYLDGFVYINNTLSYFAAPEGRVRNTGSALKNEYVLTDQQGNARISIEENPAMPGLAVVRQENSYYAFGLVMANSPVSMPTTDNKNLYNGGSEWQKDFSNNLPDYYETFYRNYDAALGRFVSVDPMPESAESLSSYNYAGNNPVMFNDPLGDRMAYDTDPFDTGFNQQVGDIWTENGVKQGFTTNYGGGGSWGFFEDTEQKHAKMNIPNGDRVDVDNPIFTNPYELRNLAGATSIDLSHNGSYLVDRNGNVSNRYQKYGIGAGDLPIDWKGTDAYLSANQGGYPIGLKDFIAIAAGEAAGSRIDARNIASVMINRINAAKSSLNDPDWMSASVHKTGLPLGGTVRGNYQILQHPGQYEYAKVMGMSIEDIMSSDLPYIQGALQAYKNWSVIDYSNGAYKWSATPLTPDARARDQNFQALDRGELYITTTGRNTTYFGFR